MPPPFSISGKRTRPDPLTGTHATPKGGGGLRSGGTEWGKAPPTR